MKKIFALALLGSIILSSSVMAQSASKQGFLWGVKLGANASDLTNGYVSSVPGLIKEPKLKLGTSFGFFFQAPVAPKLNIETGLEYSREGALQDAKIGQVTANNFVLYFTHKLTYLNLPVMLQYNGTGKGFYAEFGPQLGFLLGAKLKTENPGGNTGATETDKADKFKGTNFSLGAGAGYHFGTHFGVGLRYNLGLSKLSDEVPNMKGNTLNISVRYRIKG